MEIKVTVSLEERTKDTIDRLIDAMNREVVIKVDEPEKAKEAAEPEKAKEAAEPKKKTKPPKASTENAEEWTTNEEVSAREPAVAPKIEPQRAKEEMVGQVTTAEETITIEELRALLASTKREKGTDAIKAILKSYGVSLLSDLDPANYGEVAKKVRGL